MLKFYTGGAWVIVAGIPATLPPAPTGHSGNYTGLLGATSNVTCFSVNKTVTAGQIIRVTIQAGDGTTENTTPSDIIFSVEGSGVVLRDNCCVAGDGHGRTHS